MLALFSLITINLDSVLQSVRGEVDCEVFLELGLENDRILTLGQELLALHGVQGAYFVSPEMALGEFREELGEDAILLDAVGENPLVVLVAVALGAWAFYSIAATLVPNWRRQIALSAHEARLLRWLAVVIVAGVWIYEIVRLT